MVALPRVLLALVSLAGLTAAIIPVLLLGGRQGQNGKSPLLGGLLSGGGLAGSGQGLLTEGGGNKPLGLPFGPGAHSILGTLLGIAPLMHSLGGSRGPSGPGGSGVGAPSGNTGAGPADSGGGAPSAASSAGSGGTEDSSEEEKSKRKRNKKPPRVPESDTAARRRNRNRGSGRGAPKPGRDSSEEDNGRSKKAKGTNSSENNAEEKPRKRSRKRCPQRPKKSKGSSEEDSEEKNRKRRRRGRQSRDKRSVMDEFGLMGVKGMHHAADNVPDHVKLVYCGRNEVPNPGGIEDHFCHPEATWDTLLRMRPDCVCQHGYLRNSWGECISLAECDHCSDKHHLNMDYHLCESPCPVVCNQPIDENCANMCFKECACRPGYIRAYQNGPCVSIKQCLPGCRGRNQIFSLCSSLCPPTCRKPVPNRCPKICAGEGCVCKPGYVVKRWEPLECVRLEDCPGRRRKCPGPNQRYTRCIRRCVPSCFKRRHRYCGHECLGRGCVCKRGYVALQRRPLVCVRRDQCPKRRKKCPVRNQVYLYCKSKCPRTCDNPKPSRCGWACDGEGCACKPGYVMKQEDPLICVRHYQCSSEFNGLEMLKGGMAGAKGGMGGAKGGLGAEEAKGGMGAKGGIGEKGVIGAEEAKGVIGAEEAEGAKGVEGTKGRRRKKGSSKRQKPSWEFNPQ